MSLLIGSEIPSEAGVVASVRDVAIGLAGLTRREPAAPPADPLLDLTLPESLRTWLKPAADALGLTIVDDDARDKYGRLVRRVTYLTNANGDIRRTLLHIPPKLADDSRAYPFLNAVVWAMDDNAFVAVFAQDVMAPASVNANVIDVLWMKMRPTIDSRFIAWSFVRELPTLDLVDQIEFMRTRLGLEMLAPRPQTQSPAAGAPPAELTVKDVERIVAILSARSDFNDTRSRGTLLLQAGLNGLAGTVDLQGASQQVGVDLVWALRKHPDRVPPDNHTALGALLRTVMDSSDTPPDDANWLKSLITRCAL